MGQIRIEECGIEGLYIVTPTVHGDSRGYFMETYNERDFREAGLDMRFVQDNQSMSSKGVLRGLHYQKDHPQGKLVSVIMGSVFDVAVDIRPGSRTEQAPVLYFKRLCPRFPCIKRHGSFFL